MKKYIYQDFLLDCPYSEICIDDVLWNDSAIPQNYDEPYNLFDWSDHKYIRSILLSELDTTVDTEEDFNDQEVTIMRISEIDLQCEDIMWFATDTNGNIFECTSAGCGNVPEYVCRSREETETLLEYFMKKAPAITTAKLLIPAEDNDLIFDIKNLASKGLYCFDLTDYNNDDKYSCIARPEKAIHISEVPSEIQKLLTDHIYNGNVSAEHTITVDHAY